MKKFVLAALAATALSGTAHAVTYTFDSDTVQLNATPSGFTVEQGSVDIVADNTYNIRCKGNAGNCLDLNGTTSAGGVVLTNNVFHVDAGGTYLISLDVSGNQRGGSPDLFTGELLFNPNITLTNLKFFVDGVLAGTLGSLNTSLALGQTTLASNFPWTNYAVQFTASTASDFKLRLGTSVNDGDNMGPVVDNISFSSAVPEPATWAMMIVGFGAIGWSARRSRRSELRHQAA